jgi:hypothetical protein
MQLSSCLSSLLLLRSRDNKQSRPPGGAQIWADLDGKPASFGGSGKLRTYPSRKAVQCRLMAKVVQKEPGGADQMLALDDAGRNVFARMMETLKTPSDWFAFATAVGAFWLSAFLIGYYLRKELFTPADAPKHANWENLRRLIKRPKPVGSAPLTFHEYTTLQATFESLHTDGTEYQKHGLDRCLAGLPFQWTGIVNDVHLLNIFMVPTTGSGLILLCEFKAGTNYERSRSLKKGDQITIRGVFSDIGGLDGCEFVD